jgi:hypothetical protein
MTNTYGVNVYPGATKGQPPISVDTEIIAMVGMFPVDKEANATKGHPQEWYRVISLDDFKSAYGTETFWGTNNLDRSAGFVTPKSAITILEGGVWPLLIYNIFDPTAHTTAITDESVTFTALAPTQPVAQKWALIDTFVVTDDPFTVTYVEGTDYSLARNNTTGFVEITRIDTGAIGATDSILVDYDYIDPTTVTTAELTAGIDKVQTIIEDINFANWPGWLHCPWYSKIAVSGTDPALIRAQLKANAINLNSSVTVRFLYDIDETDYTATVVAGSPDLSKISDDKDVTSEHGRVFFGEGGSTGRTEQLLSDWFLVLQTAEVAANEFPCVSPSNRVLEDYTPNNTLKWPDNSNAVRDFGIITTQLDPGDRGYTLWGTNTSYFNGTKTDLRLDSTNQNDLEQWLRKAITRDVWVQNTDRNFNKFTAQTFVEKWNALGKQQVSKGKVLGWELSFNPDDNPDLSSYIKFRLALLGPEPMARTDVEFQIDLAYFATVFG